MMRDTGLGIGLAIAVPILIGLVTDFIALGVGIGLVAGVVVALRWPPRLRDVDVDEESLSSPGPS
ncbi:MAG TPA: hypothetical protein VJ978_09015 [Nitriliruptoraceae bacterium]|nr:hypothetical protein [Nitriliruptoraceae bacterium]